MANKYTVMSEEATRYLCGLIRNVVSLPSEIISNISLADNLTFSNIYIKDLVEQCLIDAKDYADLICGSLIKLTCEKTTVQPTLDNSELNIIYLFSDDGNAPFEQFLKISDTELIDMGSTSISLNDYLTVTDAVKTYCTITDYETLKNEVVAVKNTIGTETLTTIATTLKGAINELEAKHYLEVYDLQNTSVLDYAKTFDALTHNYFYANNCIDLPDNMNYGYCAVDVSQDPLYRDITFYCPTSGRIYVNTIGADPNDATVFGTWSGWHRHLNDDDIVTTIDSTSTDEQIPSAKVVYDSCIKDNNIKTYTSLEQLGLNGGCDVTEIVNAMPEHSYAEIGCYNTANSYGLEVITGLPNGEANFILTIRKYNYHRVDIQAKSSASGAVMNDLYIGGMVAGGTSISWKKVCSTSVADVPVTSIIIDTTKFTKKEDSSYISYCVVNGMCTIQVDGIGLVNTGNITVGSGLPKPSLGKSRAILQVEVTKTAPTKPVYIQVVNDTLSIYSVDSNGYFWGDISYPIAES